MGIIRFVLLGAAGFGVGGALAGIFGAFVAIPVVGAVGGAALGLALRDRRRLVVLALAGALGMFLGLLAVLTLGSFVNYSTVVIGPVFGAVLGASLGVAFLDARRVLILTLAGAVGFGIGFPAGSFLDYLTDSFGRMPFIVVAGIIGGASLGAALGYLEEGGRAGGGANRRVR